MTCKRFVVWASFGLFVFLGFSAFATEVRLNAPAVGEREVVMIDPKGEDCIVLRVDVPICDVQEMWMPSWLVPRQDRKWTLRDVSAPQGDLPYVAYFNTSGRNAFSIGSASFVWDTQILSCMNQEAGVWEVTITVVAGPEGALTPFAVTLDRRPIDWVDVFADWRASLKLPKGDYPEAAWKPVYCSWYAVHAALSQAWVDQTAEMAAQLGFKTFILDDGWSYDESKRVNPVTLKTWYQDVGTWDIFSAKKFPDFKRHREHMRALGLKYLVWVSPYFVGTRSELYTKGGFDKKGETPVEGNVLADPTDRAFMDTVDDQLVRLMKEADLDGLKIDFLNAIPPSVKKPRGAASLAYVERLMKKLRAVKPDGLFEFRQTYATPLTAPLATQFRAGDVPFEWLANFLCLAQIRVTMGNGVPIHADPIFWSATETKDNINRHFLAAMAGVPMLSMDLEKMSEAERKIVQRWLTFYTTHVEKFQRAGAWRVDYKNGGVAAVSATLGDEAFVIVNDADFVSPLAHRLSGKKLIVANLTFQTLDFGEGRRVPAAEAVAFTEKEDEHETVWPFAILRCYGSYTENARFIDQVFAAQKRHPGLFNEIWFCGDGGVDETADERAKGAIEQNLPARERCRELGIAFSFQQGVTLNHGPDGIKRGFIPDDAWAVDRDGRKLYGVLCCTSPWALDYQRETAKAILKGLEPESYWLDDDLRLSKENLRSPTLCFCDRCVKLFSAAYGAPFTRESLVQALDHSAEAPQVRAAWSAFNGSNLGACAKVYREAVDAVSPKTRLGLQIALSGNTIDGNSWKTILEALAGEKGQAGVRPGGLYYTDFNPRELPAKMILVAREAARSGALPATGQICYEVENWPHIGGNKNAHAMMTECAWALAVGCDSIAYYWGADQNGEDEASSDFWFETVWAHRPFHRAIRAAFAGTRLGGVAAYHGANFWATDRWTSHEEGDLAKMIACGVPVSVTEAAPDAYFLNARAIETLCADDLKTVFARPVLMSVSDFDLLAQKFPTLGFVQKVSLDFIDGEKALATVKRTNGYEKFPSGLKCENVKAFITPRADDVKVFSTMTADEATCGTCVVPTEFGGSVVLAQDVPAHWPHGVWPGCRRRAVLDALDFATTGGQSARLLTDGYSVAITVRKTADGQTAGLFLFNLGLGETPPLEVAIRRGAYENWAVLQPRRARCPAEVVRQTATETILRVPPLGAYDALLVTGE